MKPGSLLAIYLLFWTLTLFAVLPFGVRTSDESGVEKVPGEADSAPHNPMLVKKFVWTTVVSGVFFALFWANYVNGWIGLADIPGWNHYGPYQPAMTR